ncbi:MULTISPECIES: hypothetical protein [unclassified Streptomyces]|uniref:hypothetical protein n=1 Tax=unclassified Streptomyces TaxID=2593676 RepID=UPI003826DD1D
MGILHLLRGAGRPPGAVSPRRTWRTEQLSSTGTATTAAKPCRPLKAITEAAAMVRAGQPPEKAAPIHQHSDLERRQEVASGLDDLVRAAREKADENPSGADLVRDERYCAAPFRPQVAQGP